MLLIIEAMEGFGVKKLMEQLKRIGITVTKVLHDRDASTLKQVVDIFQDASESLCVGKCRFRRRFVRNVKLKSLDRRFDVDSTSKICRLLLTFQLMAAKTSEKTSRS